MYVESLHIHNFRNYRESNIECPPSGLTLIVGSNGQGKTNFLEALGFLATGRSFRGANNESVVRVGTQQAVLRGDAVNNGRHILVETEVSTTGITKTLINRQRARNIRDLAETLAVTSFSPDDLQIVKGGPSERRTFIDDLVGGSDLRGAAIVRDVDRVIRQRNSLLKQAGGKLSQEISSSLDIWDQRMAELGEALHLHRERTINTLRPYIQESYRIMAKHGDVHDQIQVEIVSSWREPYKQNGLLDTLQGARQEDIRRGITTKGPHRDDVELTINNMPARTHASQGEQRTLALCLRLAAHNMMTELLSTPPILLLDDLLSELDDERVEQFLESIPTGQVFLTTTSGVGIPSAHTERVLAVSDGRIS